MIEIVLGNIGSGKTASVVRDIVRNRDGKTTFSNIIMKDVSHNIQINRDMIVQTVPDPLNPKKQIEKLNDVFWQNVVKQYKSINVVIDEAHTILNARRGMSKQNIIMSDFMALLRRVIGGASEGYGKLTLITQLDRRIDVIAREMATRITFCRCHYEKKCNECGTIWNECNDMPEKLHRCYQCDSLNITQQTFVIEIFLFANIEQYEKFMFWGVKTFYSHYYITDIETYFPYYDTLQWDNLISV
jgi:predicted Zn-ribbon and HTH transcriptional regulator